MWFLLGLFKRAVVRLLYDGESDGCVCLLQEWLSFCPPPNYDKRIWLSCIHVSDEEEEEEDMFFACWIAIFFS